MATLNIPSMQDLLSAGVHFGHKVSRAHPKMKQFIFGARDGVDIIDLALSEEKLKEATQKAFELGKEGKSLLIIATKKQAKDIVEELAKEVGAYYLTSRWIGGLLTNFDEIKKNIKKLNQLKSEQEKGELSRYTKKEQLLIDRKLNKFQSELGGVSQMEKNPDFLFVVDGVSDNTAVKEAQKMGLMVVGICDTNANPNWYDYPVPANDDGIKSIKIICETVIKAYGQGKKEFSGTTGTEEAKPKEETKKAKEVKKDAQLKQVEQTEDVQEAGVADEETAALEQEVEQKILEEQERKV